MVHGGDPRGLQRHRPGKRHATPAAPWHHGGIDAASRHLRLSGPGAALLLAAAACAAALLPAAGRTGDQGSALVPMAAAWIREGWAPLLWLCSAAGLGGALRRALAPDAPAAMALPAGTAALMALDQVCGMAGVLAGPAGAWSALAPGLLLLLLQAVRGTPSAPAGPGAGAPRLPWWPAGAALAVLLLAAASSPGWLWSTEFGGYDALSYHLQLPREWLAAGRLGPLAHNAYSFLPGWAEGATLHLFALGGDPVLLGLRAQMLQALLAVAAAISLGAAAGPAAGVLLLGTPWIVVTGSMAYAEMGALLGGAGILMLVQPGARPGAPPTWRRGVLLGLLAALVTGCKPSAAPILLLPLALLALIPGPRGRVSAPLLLGAAVSAVLLLSPWLIRNAAMTGNPIFPFGTRWLGAWTWDAAQVEAWRSGHAAGGHGSAAGAVWDQFLRFGVGPNPAPGEPWQPLFGLLPWAALAALCVLLARPATRAAGVAYSLAIGSGLLAWLLLTHWQSRFLVPLAPLLAAATGMALHSAAAGARPAGRRAAATLLLCLCSAQPLLAWWREGPAPAAMVDAEWLMSGDAAADALRDPQLPAPERERLSSIRAVAINHGLPPGSRTLLVGDAAPYRYRSSVLYTTVWCRQPLLAPLTAGRPPEETISGLRSAGVTHVLVDGAMLSRWQRSGWLDPALTPERVKLLASRLVPLRNLDGGAVLYALPPG
ncbi:MAG: hypothetical protein U0574_05495 [Phycisphaerales bacterium]